MEHLSIADFLAINNVAFEWAHSYDTKDWKRLYAILAPSVRLDLRNFGAGLHEGLTPDAYAAILSSDNVIGRSRLKTQHLLGGGSWDVCNHGVVHVRHQLRVAHQLYTDDTKTEVANKGHAHGSTLLSYRKIDGAWKIESVVPKVEWIEGDLQGCLAPDVS